MHSVCIAGSSIWHWKEIRNLKQKNTARKTCYIHGIHEKIVCCILLVLVSAAKKGLGRTLHMILKSMYRINVSIKKAS